LSAPPSEDGPRILFVVDDGWLTEKIDLFRYLKDQGLVFDVATHRHWTLEPLQEFSPIPLNPEPLRKAPAYIWRMFWAKELDTNLTRMMGRLAWTKRPWHWRMWNRLRSVLGTLGLRRVTYDQQLRKLYQGSTQYREWLNRYEAVVYNPVSVQDKRILYETLQHPTCRLISWVYSWDNPYKDHEFIPDADAFLVWNEEGRQDLKRLHGVDPDRVETTGPVQFEYLLGMDLTPDRTQERYVLFTCSIAVDEYIDQEVDLIQEIASILERVDASVRLKVRPYPFRHADRMSFYDPLKSLPNVDILSYGELNGTVRVSSKADLQEKARQLRDASAVLNLGSTIGLEASFTQAPILQLIPKQKRPDWDIREMLDNEHLRFFLREGTPNVIPSHEELETALREILSGNPAPYLRYSHDLQAVVVPEGTDSFFASFHDRLDYVVFRKGECLSVGE